MTEPIPAEVMEEARKIADEVVSCAAPCGALAAQVKVIARALYAERLAAEKRGEQRERERAIEAVTQCAQNLNGPTTRAAICAEVAISIAAIRSPT